MTLVAGTRTPKRYGNQGYGMNACPKVAGHLGQPKDTETEAKVGVEAREIGSSLQLRPRPQTW